MESAQIEKESHPFRSKSTPTKLQYQFSNFAISDDEVEETTLYSGILSYQAFLAVTKDCILRQAPDISISRADLKSVAMKCAVKAIKGIKHDLGKHVDLELARGETGNFLNNVRTLRSPSTFSDAPRYLALFLNDVVSLACTGATFTIEDKSILELQEVSVALVHEIVMLFANTVDPDIQIDQGQATSGCENKILSQFLSQLLGAVRVALSTPFAADLYYNCGTIVCELIQRGFIADPVTIKRLIKTLLSFCEESSASRSDISPPHSFSATSAIVSEDVLTSCHLVGAAIAAKLFSIPFPEYNNTTQLIKDSTRHVVSSALEESLPILATIWFNIVIDGARLFPFDTVRNGGDNSSNDVLTYSGWKEESNPLRGGLTYSPYADIASLRSRYNDILPYVAVAVVSSQQTRPDLFAQLFSLSLTLVMRLLDESAPSATLSSNGVLVGKIFRSFVAYIKRLKNQVTSIVPLSEWNNLISFSVAKIRRINLQSIDTEYLTNSCLQLNSAILHQIADLNLHTSEFDQFLRLVWAFSFQLARSIVPQVFSYLEKPPLNSTVEVPLKVVEPKSIQVIPLLVNTMASTALLNTDYIPSLMQFFSLLTLHLASTTNHGKSAIACIESVISLSQKLCVNLIPIQVQNISFRVMEDVVQISLAYKKLNSTLFSEQAASVMSYGLTFWKSVISSPTYMVCTLIDFAFIFINLFTFSAF